MQQGSLFGDASASMPALPPQSQAMPSPKGRIARIQRARRALERAGLTVRAVRFGPQMKFLVRGYAGSFTPTQIVALAQVRGRY